MRNFEGGVSNIENEQTGWESINKDNNDFEESRGARRYEAMQGSEEAKGAFKTKVNNLIKTAMMTLAIVGTLMASGCASSEIMDREHENIETIDNVVSVSIKDGPNIRENPFITGKGELSNVIMDSGREGDRIDVSYQGVAYRYDNDGPDGSWYGFSAEGLANQLYEGAYIKNTKGFKADEDGVVWINGSYVEIERGELAN